MGIGVIQKSLNSIKENMTLCLGLSILGTGFAMVFDYSKNKYS